MRHVVFGADTTIGSAIVRILSTLGVEDIIACSTTGHIPRGVDRRRIDDRVVDLLDAYSIYDLLQTDDIVYNIQVVDEDTAQYEEASLYNMIGLINLLGISTQAQVAKIVTYLPQQLGWEVPDHAKEDTPQENPSPVQRSLLRYLQIVEDYVEGKDYGWNPETLAGFVQFADDSSTDDQAPDTTIEMQIESTPTSGPQMRSGPSLGGSSLKTKQEGANSAPTSSGPSLKGATLGSESQQEQTSPKVSTGPDISTSTEKIEESDTTVTDTTEDPDIDDDNEESPLEVNEELIEEIEELDRVDVVLLRIPRLFGPFIDEPVVRFCEGIRLQRLGLVGKCDSTITWINPLDAARALIIAADTTIQFEHLQYNVNGFNATCMEILQELDNINHSDAQIDHSYLFPHTFLHWVKSLFSVIGVKNDNSYYTHLRYNKPQTFDDSRARKEWNWEPKYDFEKSVKDSLTWYLNSIG